VKHDGQDPKDQTTLLNAVKGNRIRAAFLRFLALGGDEFAPVDEAGIELRNALIEGDLDLRGGKCVGRLVLAGCFFSGKLSIEDADLGMVSLTGSAVSGISGNSAKLSGNLSLDNGLVSSGEVSLAFAAIGQNLICGGAEFRNPGGMALNCGGAKISGSVLLGAKCAEGTVFFASASIGVDFDCRCGHFCNAQESQFDKTYAREALNLSGATIGLSLFLGVQMHKGGTHDPQFLPPKIEGSVNLMGTTVRILIDGGLVGDPERGLRRDVKGNTKDIKPNVEGNSKEIKKTLTCQLGLALFSYERILGAGACNAKLRKAWLKLQPPEELKKAFNPQPFEQLVKVLRSQGYADEADDIALCKRRLARQAKPWWWPKSFVDLVLDGFVGYGYKKTRGLALLLVIGLVFAPFYHLAFQQGAIVPAAKEIRDAHKPCDHWSLPACRVKGEPIPEFNAGVYSFDIMIPIIGLGQKAAWTPAAVSINVPRLGTIEWPNLVYYVQLAEGILGWIGGSLLLSVVTGLISKE
jgi:hypothetical protein